MPSHQFRRALRIGVTATLLAAPAFADVTAEPLTLPQARSLTLARSPELASFAAEIRAREAQAMQAGRLPNPQLRADLEDVGGTGDREEFEQTETTLRISQLIELGGKRNRRQRIAALSHDVAAWDYETKKRSVLGNTTKAFIRALAAQERLTLAGQLEDIARKAVDAVTAHVGAGASPDVEITRARVALGRSEIEKNRADRALATARAALAATWGDEQPAFGELEGDLAIRERPPSLREIETKLERSPELARATTEAEERRATLALEQAARIPDVTVGAGARHFSDSGDYALVFEIDAPIPVFDRNQGGIAAARHRLDRAQAEKDAIRLALRAALTAVYADHTTAYEQATHLRDRVLPTAERAFDEALRAYRQGLFRFVEVLDAQRTLFELRADYLADLESFHLSAAELERLTGRSLSETEPAEGFR